VRIRDTSDIFSNYMTTGGTVTIFPHFTYINFLILHTSAHIQIFGREHSKITIFKFTVYKIQFFRTRDDDDDFELVNRTRKEISVPQSEESRKVCVL
jgi:hypothetical protein